MGRRIREGWSKEYMGYYVNQAANFSSKMSKLKGSIKEAVSELSKSESTLSEAKEDVISSYVNVTNNEMIEHLNKFITGIETSESSLKSKAQEIDERIAKEARLALDKTEEKQMGAGKIKDLNEYLFK